MGRSMTQSHTQLPRWRNAFLISLVTLLVILFVFFILPAGFDRVHAQEPPLSAGEVSLTIVGRVVNSQNLAIAEASVRVFLADQIEVEDEADLHALTDAQGFFILDLNLQEDSLSPDAIALEIRHPGYRVIRRGFGPQDIVRSGDQAYLRLPDQVLPRVFNAAFFIATAIFVAAFAAITFSLLHETIAALLGAGAMLGITYFFGSNNPDYWIVGFDTAVHFIDFDVIFLLLTMMIFMAITSQTGVFQWLAFQTLRLARGKPFLVTAGLILLSGITSSVLNDTTVMLLMTPVSIQIALAMNIHPAAIVVPEVLASNIGGAATLIGTPPNTIIGSYVGLSFNAFLSNMVPISIMSMLILVIMTRWLYREEFGKKLPREDSLLDQLQSRARITNKVLLMKSITLFGVTLITFFLADRFSMPPAVVALMGSSALLLWVRPDVGDMLREVDWTTLVFFMSLFMMVGGIQEVGLIQVIAEAVESLAGGNLILATTLVIWVSTVASAVVANIPFTSAIVPVAVFLTQTIPGAENNVLYWALALGAGLGGNATYIGSAPNMVAVGILERAGYRIKFMDFSKVGIPVTFVTVFVPMLWIFIRYFWLHF